MSAAQRPFLTASNRCEPPGQTVALDEARSNELETLVSMLAILNPEDDEARRCQGCHRAVKAALPEKYDRVEQVMPNKCQAKNNIK